MKSIQIAIPRPCQESWQNMEMTHRGAFCLSCRKEVIDFSVMTDREVIEYLAKNETGCGRFRMNQVNTKLALPKFQNGFLGWRALILSILALGAAKNVAAKLPGTIIHPEYLSKTARTVIPADPYGDIRIHGRVSDDSGLHPDQVLVELLDSSGHSLGIQVTTDSLGRFAMTIPKETAAKYPLQLQLSHWHYETKTIALNRNDRQEINVKLEEIYKVMGAVKFIKNEK